MKRVAVLLALAALSGPGCVAWDPNFFTPKPPPAPAAKEPEAPKPPPPIVTAAQITERNAGEMMEALLAELEYDATDHPAPPPAPAVSAGSAGKSDKKK